MKCRHCGRFMAGKIVTIKGAAHHQFQCRCGGRSRAKRFRIKYGPPIIMWSKGVEDDVLAQWRALG